jgi:hypothetical protein
MPDPSRPSPSRTILLGLAVFFFGVLVTLSPILLGRGSLNRYIVVFGLIGVFIGGSAAINGLWDWLRGRGP